jgi:hypothetical protein
MAPDSSLKPYSAKAVHPCTEQPGAEIEVGCCGTASAVMLWVKNTASTKKMLE